jgi:hypothetical protein
MAWSLVFKALLLLAPVPVCWVLYRYLSASTASLSGSLLERLNFQTSGPLAVYFIVLGITSYVVAPEVVERRIAFLDADWSYTLLFKEDSAHTDHQNGAIRIISGPAGTFKALSMHDSHLHVDKGLINNEWLYLNLKGAGQQKLVAFGPRENDPDRVSLPVYQLPGEWVKEASVRTGPLSKVGDLVLERQWPFLMLSFVVLLPLTVVFLLSRIGPPLVAKLSGEYIKLASWSHIPANRIKLELTGSAAVYALVLLVVGYISYSAGHDFTEQEGIARKSCMNKLSGTWYFELSSFGSGETARQHFVGKIEIECNEVNGMVQLVNGVGNRTDVQYDSGKSCYEHVLPPGGISWKSLVASITEGELLAVFQTSAGEDTGLLRGKIDAKQMYWSYYDFRESEHHENARDRGHVVLVRPTENSIKDCQILQKKINGVVK